ncbi:MAG: hypothetical protein JJU37_10290 [Balneolaceae bacterium]|nr:hypothetical protein [Balneolaceae bacterium]
MSFLFILNSCSESITGSDPEKPKAPPNLDVATVELTPQQGLLLTGDTLRFQVELRAESMVIGNKFFEERLQDVERYHDSVIMNSVYPDRGQVESAYGG